MLTNSAVSSSSPLLLALGLALAPGCRLARWILEASVCGPPHPASSQEGMGRASAHTARLRAWRTAMMHSISLCSRRALMRSARHTPSCRMRTRSPLPPSVLLLPSLAWPPSALACQSKIRLNSSPAAEEEEEEEEEEAQGSGDPVPAARGRALRMSTKALALAPLSTEAASRP